MPHRVITAIHLDNEGHVTHVRWGRVERNEHDFQIHEGLADRLDVVDAIVRGDRIQAASLDENGQWVPGRRVAIHVDEHGTEWLITDPADKSVGVALEDLPRLREV